MAESPKKSSRILELVLIAVVTYFLSQAIFTYFSPKETGETTPGAQQVSLRATTDSIRYGNAAIIAVVNGTDKPFTLQSNCPMPPFAVFRVEGTGTGTLKPLTTTEAAAPCEAIEPIPAGEEAEVTLAPWKYSLFGEFGTYEVRLPEQGSGAQISQAGVRFAVYEPGIFAKLFRAFITKPFFNFLLFVASLLPDHNLGISIIVLTIIVKLLLFYPTQKSLEGQKKMQLLQPKLDAVRKQHKDNPTKMQEETMRLWKEHGVNPAQSCLPLLLQFPVLIGLFYVIRDGADPALSQHLTYPFYQHLDWSFGKNFLGLDLTQPSWIFPPLLVALQFLQMKLTFMIAKNKKKPDDAAAPDKAQQLQQQMMTYIMPLFIGFLAIRFPAAVSLYWGVSTLFGIGQQMIVNREHLKV